MNLDDKKPFVYTRGRYSAEFNKTTVAFPLTSGRNGNVLVFDLRNNLEELLQQEEPKFYPAVKELCLNRCPAVAPMSLLGQKNGWEKIGLSPETVQKNLEILLKHPEFAEKMRSEAEERPEFPEAEEPEAAIYDGFVNDADRVKIAAVRNADENKLADFCPDFHDPRLPELLLHYKGRNFPRALSETEAAEYEKYRRARLEKQAPRFIAELERVASQDDFVAEELKLYFESLFDTDY